MPHYPLRFFYPVDWLQISARIRFSVPGPHGIGHCWTCGRPHGAEIRCLQDGRWLDPASASWRDGQGGAVTDPEPADHARGRTTVVVLAAAHLDHEPSNNSDENLKALCQRCHMLHDLDHHRKLSRLTVLRRRAAGDLFLGPYERSRIDALSCGSHRSPKDAGPDSPP
jgi:hypothetical protein